MCGGTPSASDIKQSQKKEAAIMKAKQDLEEVKQAFKMLKEKRSVAERGQIVRRRQESLLANAAFLDEQNKQTLGESP